MVFAQQATGGEIPEGHLHHVAGVKEDGSIIVMNVWDSAESLAEVGNTLMPALQKA